MGEAKTDRSDANRNYYRKSKTRQEAALLRLDMGDLARLDQVCQTAGLSRSAFAKLYLLPMADAIAARLGEIEGSRQARGISLATFIERAFDHALSAEPEVHAGSSAASCEFDALFGAGSADGGA